MRYPFSPRKLAGLGLLVAALGLVGYFAQPGKGRERGSEARSPFAPGFLTGQKNIHPASGALPESPVSWLEQGSPSQLFSRLFSPRTGEAPSDQELLEGAAKRFERTYSLAGEAHLESPLRGEISARLGILKALGTRPLSEESIAFLRKVAGNPREHWLVQRQALRNLLPWSGGASERERLELLGRADPRAVAAAALSERELLGEIVNDSGKRAPANLSKYLEINDYSLLPCPSAQKFLSLAKAVNWQLTGPYTCDLSPQGKVGRLLLFLESLDFSGVSTGVHGQVGENLRRPWAYFTSHVTRLGIDLDQETTKAHNEEGRISLGAVFFAETPIDGLETLIHEARHSEAGDPGHVTCVQGDIPAVAAGCDFELSDGANAGAYSYGVFFLFELAHLPHLAPGDREFLLSDALAMASQRFNRLPPRLAQFLDGIVGTDAESHLIFFHPFARYSYPISTFLPKAQVIQGLDYDDRTGGAMLLTAGPAVKVWNWDAGISPYFPEILVSGGYRVRYANKLGMVRGANSFTYSVFTDEDYGLHYLAYDNSTGQPLVRRFEPGPVGYSARSFCLGSQHSNYFLSVDGVILSQRTLPLAESFVYPAWAQEQKWKQINCGVLHDSLFAVGADGLLYRQEMQLAGSMDKGWAPSAQGAKSDLQAGGAKAQAYHEGTQLRALLDDAGALHVQIYRHAEEQFMLRSFGRKITDFTFFRLFGGRGLPLRRPNQDRRSRFGSHCEVAKPEQDPWLGLGVGVNHKGFLVFEGHSGECVPAAMPVAWQGRIKSFSFGSESFGRGLGVLSGLPLDKTYFFAPAYLELQLTNGETHRLHPYEGWSDLIK